MRTRILAGLMLALGLLLALFLWSRDRSAERASSSQRAQQARASTPSAGPALETARTEQARERAPGTDESAVDLRDAASDPGPPPLRIRGRVLEADTRLPLTDASVQVFDPQLYKAMPVCWDATDEQGAFELECDEPAWAAGTTVRVLVRDAESQLRLQAFVALQDGLLLLVPAALELRGTLILTGGRSTAGWSVSVWTPATGDSSVERFIGNQDVGSDGRFAIRISPQYVPAAFVVRAQHRGMPISVRVPAVELTAPGGARIEISVANLALRVQDDAGAPVVAALVRVESESLPGAPEALFTEWRTSAEGTATIEVAPGVIQLAAGAPAYAPANARIVVPPEGFEVSLRLRKLGPGDVLRGQVVFEDGAPVEAAVVSAWDPDCTGETSVSSMVQTRTTSDGRFELAAPTDRILVVTAFHREHGEAEIRWNSSDGDARLVILRSGTVRIDGQGLDSKRVGTGDIALVLVGRRGGMHSLRTDHLPAEFGRVPPDAWNVYALAEGHRAWARSTVRVEARSSPEVMLAFEPCGFVEGRVLARNDRVAGLRVELAPPDWPEVVCGELLCRPVAPDGSFRVPCPTGRGELRVVDGAQIVVRCRAIAGAPLTIALAD